MILSVLNGQSGSHRKRNKSSFILEPNMSGCGLGTCIPVAPNDAFQREKQFCKNFYSCRTVIKQGIFQIRV